MRNCLSAYRYFLDFRLVPFARGMSPFAFSDAFIVKPMDFPFFHRRRYFRSRLVTRYPPRTGILLAAAQPHPPPRIIGAQVVPQDILFMCSFLSMLIVCK